MWCPLLSKKYNNIYSKQSILAQMSFVHWTHSCIGHYSLFAQACVWAGVQCSERDMRWTRCTVKQQKEPICCEAADKRKRRRRSLHERKIKGLFLDMHNDPIFFPFFQQWANWMLSIWYIAEYLLPLHKIITALLYSHWWKCQKVKMQGALAFFWVVKLF